MFKLLHISEIKGSTQFTDQQIQLKKQQTVEINLSIYVSTKYLPI